MYDLTPPAVFALRRVYDNLTAVARMERMLRAMGDPAVETEDPAFLLSSFVRDEARRALAVEEHAPPAHSAGTALLAICP